MMVCILKVNGILSGVVSGVVERRGVHKRPLKGTQKEPERPFPLAVASRSPLARARILRAKTSFFHMVRRSVGSSHVQAHKGRQRL